MDAVGAEYVARAVPAVIGRVPTLGLTLNPPDDTPTYATASRRKRQRSRAAGSSAALIWADVLGQARQHARPVARFLVLMLTAGVIAGFGVIEVNPILIVGAMAVSPDALPIAGACIALVGRRAGLAGRALGTLGLGLGAAAVAACALTLVLDLLGLLPSNFEVGESALPG